MTRPLDRHLDGDELDALLTSQALGVSFSGRLSEEALWEAQRHIESCQDCDRKVRMHRSAQNAISLRATSGQAGRGPNCSDETGWVRVAAGLLEEDEAKERMNHAAKCGHCGPLLKAAVWSLSEETTSDEEDALARFKSARPDWQARMASTLREAAESRIQNRSAISFWNRIFYWPGPLYAGAAAVLVVAAWIGVRILRSPSADQLLAQAYTERRVLEVRFRGAKYAPMHIELNGSISDFDKPEPLLKAEVLIGERLRHLPNDPAWLHAKGRADLLDGNYESAITTLQQVLDSHPDSPSVMVDLASAYYRRASANDDRQVDYAIAIDYLGRALSRTPDDSVALFNRAVCEEKHHLFEPARTDWQRYLAIDPVGSWADEATRNLKRVEEKIRKKEAALHRPFLNITEFASLPADEWIAELDNRVEVYLHLAVMQWLPEAFPRSPTQSSPIPQDAQRVLDVLAHVMVEHHGDTWLAEVLEGPHGLNFASGSVLLATALQANDRGDYEKANRDAEKAAQLFRTVRNSASELRAQVEELYSYHLLYDGARCVDLGKSLHIQLQQHRYGWLSAQTSLEQSNCAGLVGDESTVRSAADRGTSEATSHRYAGLALRGLGFQADAAASIGDVDRGVSLASQGLETFWDSEADLMKGYNLYTDLDTAADTLNLPYLQVAVWQQATSLVDLHPDVLQRAMAHRWFADAAYLANMPDLAATEISTAERLFATAPQTAATSRSELDAEIWQSALEVRKGDLDDAENRLRTAQAELERHPSYAQAVSLYTAQAELKLRRNDDVGTEAALRAATFLAEWGLQTFRSQGARHQWAERTSGAYRNLVSWKLREGDIPGALELWEWYRGAEFRADKGRSPATAQDLDRVTPPDVGYAPPVSVPTVVAQHLPVMTGETVVTLAALSDGTEIWVYDNRGIFAYWINRPAKEIRDRANGLRELCSKRDTSLSLLRSASRDLYDILMRPIEGRFLPGRTLIFEPDDSFSEIPFEVLVDSDGRYLVESHAVVTSPGLYQALALPPAQPITAETPLLIVSVPAPPVEGIDPAPAADREAQTIASRFHLAKWLDGPAASLGEIRRTLSKAEVFHFAGHASAVSTNNGLLLSERVGVSQRVRVLSADTLGLATLKNLQLAVLSACATGTRSRTSLAGTEALSQSFLRHGVRNVVASRWNVDSEATSVFMNEFYERLLSGSGVSASLRIAQLRLASQPGFSHPYYWAGFGAQGT